MKASAKKPAVEVTQQLAIFLDNRPGMLAAVCDALAEQRINILAMTTSDTVDHSVIRLVVSEPRRALLLFEERGTLVVEDEVIKIDADHQPGSLAGIAHKLAKGKVNIEYCYCASSPGSRRGLLVLRVSNPAKALRILRA